MMNGNNKDPSILVLGIGQCGKSVVNTIKNGLIHQADFLLQTCSNIPFLRLNYDIVFVIADKKELSELEFNFLKQSNSLGEYHILLLANCEPTVNYYRRQAIFAFPVNNNFIQIKMCHVILAIIGSISSSGINNVNFSGVEAIIFNNNTQCYIGCGYGKDQTEYERTKIAMRYVISELSENIKLGKIKGALVRLTAGYDISLKEFSRIGDAIQLVLPDNATIILGSTLREHLKNQVIVTVIATI